MLVVVGFLFFFFETAFAADGSSGRVGTPTYSRMTCARVGDRDVRMIGGSVSAGRSVATAYTHAAHTRGRAAHAARAHAHTSTTTGVDDDMRHAGMTGDDLSIHSDSGHPTSDLGYLLTPGFDTRRSRELVPVSELQMYEGQTTVDFKWVGETHIRMFSERLDDPVDAHL